MLLLQPFLFVEVGAPPSIFFVEVRPPPSPRKARCNSCFSIVMGLVFNLSHLAKIRYYGEIEKCKVPIAEVEGSSFSSRGLRRSEFVVH